MHALSLLLIAACAPHPAPIDVHLAETAGIAVVGATVGGGPEVDDVAAAIARGARAGEVDLVVLVGDPVRRGSRREWDAVRGLWQPAVDMGADLQPLVGSAAARGDRRLVRFGESFPQAPSYGASGMAGVQLVFADTSGDRDRHASEMFWLPSAMGADGPKVLFVPDGPEADAVVRAAVDYAPASDPSIIVFTAGAESGCAFPGGGFGEARVAVGPPSEGWWRLEVSGTGLLLWLEGGDAGRWRWDPDRGWSALPAGHPSRLE